MDPLSLDLDLITEDPEFIDEQPGTGEQPGNENEPPKEPEHKPTEDDEDAFDIPEDPNNPESVSEEEHTPQNDPSPEDGSSPNSYSSIAQAFVKDGVFSGDVISEEDIKNCKTAEDFEDLQRKYVRSMLDAEQKRVAEALDAGVTPDEIKYYQGMLKELDGITDEQLNDEGESGEKLRRNIIIQEYLNRGYSQERAASIADDSIEKGLDKEDAKKYLKTNKEYFEGAYNKLQQDRAAEKKSQEAELKKAVYETKTFFGDFEVDDATRNKAWETIMKPIKTEDGRLVNKLQQYAEEHPMEFRANLGMMFVLTKGFTDLSGLIGKKVNKQTASALREVESKLHGGSRGGGMNFVENTGGDHESYIGKGMRLDLGE